MKTALDWLVDNLHYLHSTKWNDILEQAKEMEKQQLGECWDAALDAYERRAGVWVRASVDFDEYFENTFE